MRELSIIALLTCVLLRDTRLRGINVTELKYNVDNAELGYIKMEMRATKRQTSE
jgi:hypothetical protein